ncbi:hypothetical protein D3C81_1166910 [compost metagenome]
MYRNVAVQLVFRIQVMHVSSSDNRSIQLHANLDNFADGRFQFCCAADQPFFHQMHVHCKRLDFKHVIKFSDRFRFLNRLVQHGLEKLALLTAGQDQ